MTYTVDFSLTADADLERLFNFLLDRAVAIEDLDVAQEAIEAIRSAALNQPKSSS